MSHRIHAFTFADLLVVLVVLTGLIAFIAILPMFGRARRTPRKMQNSTQVRGIHSALELYSQGNNTYYPGFDKEGKPLEDYTVENRLKILLDDNYFTSEYLIAPSESKTPWEKGPFTSANYSYALLNLSVSDSPRNNDWRDTSNSEAVVISDRAIANGKNGAIKSAHTNPHSDITQWRGSVGFNDNHVTFEATHDKLTTQYGDSEFVNDNLFDTVGASMIYKGVDTLIDPGK
jgi:type II secretory pathway pseudopilin PulG